MTEGRKIKLLSTQFRIVQIQYLLRHGWTRKEIAAQLSIAPKAMDKFIERYRLDRRREVRSGPSALAFEAGLPAVR